MKFPSLSVGELVPEPSGDTGTYVAVQQVKSLTVTITSPVGTSLSPGCFFFLLLIQLRADAEKAADDAQLEEDLVGG